MFGMKYFIDYANYLSIPSSGRRSHTKLREGRLVGPAGAAGLLVAPAP